LLALASCALASSRIPTHASLFSPVDRVLLSYSRCVRPFMWRCLTGGRLIYTDRITGYDYTMSEIATIRIDEETKRKIKQYAIPVSRVARKAILREIERREREEALQALRRMKEILSRVDIERVVQDIREDRRLR